jgi:Lrp/AsnC family leucine-responsive transcriptional regulator
VRLSAPGVSERIQRLQVRGIIQRFMIEIEPASLGYSLQALVRIESLPGKLHTVQEPIQDIAEFSECSQVPGNDCFVARLHFYNIDQLDEILNRLVRVTEPKTTIVKTPPAGPA